MMKVLITGKDSFIGTSFERYMSRWPDQYRVDTIDMMNSSWRQKSFAAYDTVFHVAGMAHTDADRISDEQKKLYYKTNTDLTIETAKKARRDGARQFIFMSSSMVYGGNAIVGEQKRIAENTPVKPENFYGDSKVKAEEGILPLSDEHFKVVVLRAPMIYGPGCKGNYPILSKFVQKLPLFPYVKNERSMLYIENLLEFVRLLVENREQGIFWPQNAEYTSTSEMVRKIGAVHGRKVALVHGFGWFLKWMGRYIKLVNKAFGNLSYEQSLSEYKEPYRVCGLEESIRRTEAPAAPRALILASVASMIDQFNMPNIKILQDAGYQVDVAANFETGSTTTRERVDEVKKNLSEQGVHVIHMSIPRRIFDSKGIFSSYKSIKKLCMERKYTLLHCHSPIGGVIARLGARRARKKYGTKVVYTAHGFHFYKGAQKKNWLLYYPAEWICSFYTDVLITINREDYRRAKRSFHAKKTEYVPGVGVDVEHIRNIKVDKAIKRQELDIPNNAFLVLSVGELNANKNHEAILRAISSTDHPAIHYAICGVGDREEYLRDLAKKLNIEDQFHLLGYRKDVIEVCKSADIFAFPSRREGLGVAALEAMACGLPLVTANVHGIRDYSVDGESGFTAGPEDAETFAIHIESLLRDRSFIKKASRHNIKKVSEFDIHIVIKRLSEIYSHA